MPNFAAARLPLPLQRQPDLGAQITSQLGKGMPIPATARTHLEGGLGSSLSTVRLHTDSTADHLARSVQAVAFTTGSDIFFRSGAYNPSTPQGMHLLTHEATHTIQQSRGPVDGTPHPGGVSISDPSDRSERAASEAAARGSDGLPVQRAGMERGAGAGGALPIQRLPTVAEVKKQVGEPKATGNQAAATVPQDPKGVLKALDDYERKVTENVATENPEFSRQRKDIQKALTAVIDACDRYLQGAGRSVFTRRIVDLKREAEQEEIVLQTRATEFGRNPSARKGTWKTAAAHGVLASGLASDMLRQAAKVEPGITQQISDTAAQHGGTMYGLEYRLKTEESLARKIHEEAPSKGLPEDVYASQIKDAVRYTAHFPTDKYTEGVKSTMAALESSGNKPYGVKNTWALGNTYRGLNTWWKSSNGTIFEVQFHTPESQDVKNINHTLYDVARLAQTTPKRRLELEQEMMQNSNSIPTPPNVLSIGNKS